MELLKAWAREATERAGGRPGPAKTLWTLHPTCSLSAPWGGFCFLFLFNCSLSLAPASVLRGCDMQGPLILQGPKGAREVREMESGQQRALAHPPGLQARATHLSLFGGWCRALRRFADNSTGSFRMNTHRLKAPAEICLSHIRPRGDPSLDACTLRFLCWSCPWLRTVAGVS